LHVAAIGGLIHTNRTTIGGHKLGTAVMDSTASIAIQIRTTDLNLDRMGSPRNHCHPKKEEHE
jgi:hypothetical protein